MQPILTAAQMREADRRAIEEIGIAGPVLMENAARGTTDLLATLLGSLRGKRIAIICGKGNNGGDGIAVARHALIAGAEVRCALLAPASELSPDARAQHDIVAAFAPETLIAWERFDRAARYDAIVDAMLGTGAGGELHDPYLDAVRWCNAAAGIKLAVDILDGKEKPKDRHILVNGDFLATNGGEWKSKLYPDAVVQKIEIGKNAFPDRPPGLTLPISPSWVEITAEEAAGS